MRRDGPRGGTGAAATEVTTRVIAVLGPSINSGKSYLSTAAPPGRVLGRPPATLRHIPLVRTFRYLGVDIVTGPASRPSAARRARDFEDRMGLIRAASFRQRGALVMDGCSSLWLAAGTCLTKSQLTRAVSAGARALASTAASQASQRSRRHWRGEP